MSAPVDDPDARHRGERRALPLVDRRTASQGTQNSCYFRSGPAPGQRKALIQITQRCDLHCAHCFVSATKLGSDMPADALTPSVLARLKDAHVTNVTITGGEPFVHPELLTIVERLVDSDIDTTICTNAVAVQDEDIARLQDLGRVSVNVSIDGFDEASHGRFRGDRDSFRATVRNTRLLGKAGLLKGILCTPHALADPSEYSQLRDLATEVDARYLLMNPLSSFGRGIKSQHRLQADQHAMTQIRASLESASDPGPDLVFVRFPADPAPLSGCVAGDIFYVFVNGDVAVCPYLVFATQNARSQHKRSEFIVGNLLQDSDIAERLAAYRRSERLAMGRNTSCSSCSMETSCAKGCPAAVVAAGGRIGDRDTDVCPTVPETAAAACS